MRNLILLSWTSIFRGRDDVIFMSSMTIIQGVVCNGYFNIGIFRAPCFVANRYLVRVVWFVFVVTIPLVLIFWLVFASAVIRIIS